MPPFATYPPTLQKVLFDQDQEKSEEERSQKSENVKGSCRFYQSTTV